MRQNQKKDAKPPQKQEQNELEAEAALKSHKEQGGPHKWKSNNREDL
jgi:uncharacterized protein (DUF4415 family)